MNKKQKERRSRKSSADARVGLAYRLVAKVMTEVIKDKMEAYTVIANILADSAVGSEQNRRESGHAIQTVFAQALAISSLAWDDKENTGKEPTR